MDRMNKGGKGRKRRRDGPSSSSSLAGDGKKVKLGTAAKGVSLGNKIRGLKRSLRRCPETDVEKRKALEKSLDELQKKVVSKKKAEIFATRYKKVKFVERKKLQRRVAKANKMLQGLASDDTDARADLLRQISSLEDDIQYIEHFPADEKYISILKDDIPPEVKKKREKFRKRATKSSATEERGAQRTKLLEMQSARLKSAQEAHHKKLGDDFFRAEKVDDE